MIARNGGLSHALESHGDMADQASGHIDNEQKLLIEAAVSSLKDYRTPQCKNTEGEVVCSDCGGQISAKRLVALPHARRCTECEEQREALGLRLPPIRFLGRRK